MIVKPELELSNSEIKTDLDTEYRPLSAVPRSRVGFALPDGSLNGLFTGFEATAEVFLSTPRPLFS